MSDSSVHHMDLSFVRIFIDFLLTHDNCYFNIALKHFSASRFSAHSLILAAIGTVTYAYCLCYVFATASSFSHFSAAVCHLKLSLLHIAVRLSVCLSVCLSVWLARRHHADLHVQFDTVSCALPTAGRG